MTNPMKHFVRLLAVILTVALVCVAVFHQHVHADDANDFSTTPVLQMMTAKGADADSTEKMLASFVKINAGVLPAGVTAETLTITDVRAMTSVTLDDGTAIKNVDGQITNYTPGVIGQWVAVNSASTVKGNDFFNIQSTSPQVIFQSGLPKWNGATGAGNFLTAGPVNLLMAMVNSATAATTVDLTGMLSGITTTGTGIHFELIDLLQTSMLPNLTTLGLGSNNIGSDDTNAAGNGYLMFWSSVTRNANKLVSLDLSNEAFTVLNDQLLSGLPATVSALNLANNPIVKIEYNGGQKVIGVTANSAQNGGTGVDLSGNNQLSTSDQNTLGAIIGAANSGGKVSLSSDVINVIVQAQVANGNSYPPITAAGVKSVAKDISQETLEKMATATGNGAALWTNPTVVAAIVEENPAVLAGLDPTAAAAITGALVAAGKSDLADEVDKLVDKKPDDPSTNPGTDPGTDTPTTADIAVTGALTFDLTYADVMTGSSSALQMTGTLPKGSSLNVTASTLAGGSTAVTPSYAFTLNNGSIVNVSAGATASVLAAGDADTSVSGLLTSTVISLPYAGVQVGTSYTGTVTWNVANTPGN